MKNSYVINATKLKVKALSLAEESKIIRRLEKGCEDKHGYNAVHQHRVHDVRREARATNLARAFLAGMHYRRVEETRREGSESQFKEVVERATSIIMRFSAEAPSDSRLEAWFAQ